MVASLRARDAEAPQTAKTLLNRAACCGREASPGSRPRLVLEPMGRSNAPALSSPIHLSAMPYKVNHQDLLLVQDLVNDTVVTHSKLERGFPQSSNSSHAGPRGPDFLRVASA